MSYTLVTETTFLSDAHDCPVCGSGMTDYLPADDITLRRCASDHAFYYIETVTGDDGRSGAGEIGYWLPA